MTSLLRKTDAWLLRLDTLLAGVAAMAIMAMMLVTAADVVMRYVLHSPLHWAYDLVLQYLLVASFFLGFSYTLRHNHHISVDFFARRLSVKSYHLLLGAGCFAAGCIFVAIAWFGAHDAWLAWENDEVIFGALIWPTWLSKIIVPVGMAPLALRCFHRAIAHLWSFRDRTVVKELQIGVDDLAAVEA